MHDVSRNWYAIDCGHIQKPLRYDEEKAMNNIDLWADIIFFSEDF